MGLAVSPLNRPSSTRFSNRRRLVRSCCTQTVSIHIQRLGWVFLQPGQVDMDSRSGPDLNNYPYPPARAGEKTDRAGGYGYTSFVYSVADHAHRNRSCNGESPTLQSATFKPTYGVGQYQPLRQALQNAQAVAFQAQPFHSAHERLWRHALQSQRIRYPHMHIVLEVLIVMVLRTDVPSVLLVPCRIM